MFYDSVKDVYEKLKDIDIEVYNPDWRYNCHACGAELRYMYCEARIYVIVCPKCKTVSLIAGRNPKEAFEMVGVKNDKNQKQLRDEMKHGKWIPADPDTRGCTLRFACSVCGNYTTYYEDAHECDYDYCPNCGAKMDLEE